MVEAEESEVSQEVYPFTVADAEKESILAANIRDVGIDWVTAYSLEK